MGGPILLYGSPLSTVSYGWSIIDLVFLLCHLTVVQIHISFFSTLCLSGVRRYDRGAGGCSASAANTPVHAARHALQRCGPGQLFKGLLMSVGYILRGNAY